MSEAEADRARPPRFPYVAALLCAACVGAAGWTWMRYSYAWDLSPDYIYDRTLQVYEGKWPAGAYVRVESEWIALPSLAGGSWSGSALAGSGTAGKPVYVSARVDDIGTVACGRVGVQVERSEDFREWNRFSAHTYVVQGLEGHQRFLWPRVTTATSRFHGASIAGLVVGAMGVFVFAVALRHWLNQRMSLHVEAVEGDT